MSSEGDDDKRLFELLRKGGLARDEGASRRIAIMLIGEVGNGKSSLGNTLVGEEVFRVGHAFNSQTAKTTAKVATANVDGVGDVEVAVIDTPGFGDIPAGLHAIKKSARDIEAQMARTAMSDGEKRRDLADKKRALDERMDEMTAKHRNARNAQIKEYINALQADDIGMVGVDAFVYVIRLDARTTETSLDALFDARELFDGNDFDAHVWIVFTHADQRPLLTPETLLASDHLTAGMQEYIEKTIDNRFTFVDNTVLKADAARAQAWRNKFVKSIIDHAIPPFLSIRFVTQNVRELLVRELREQLDAYEEKKIELVRMLENMSVGERHGNTIAKLAGSAVSLGVGLPMMIAGVVLVPVTFGASLGLTIGGAAVSLAGSVTSVGVSVQEYRSGGSDAQKLMELHWKQTVALMDLLYDKQSEFRTIQRQVLPEPQVYVPETPKIKVMDVASPVAQVAGTAVRTGGNIVAHLGADVAKGIGVAAAKAIPIAGLATGGVLDVASIVYYGTKIHEEKKRPEAIKGCFLEMRTAVAKFENAVDNFFNNPQGWSQQRREPQRAANGAHSTADRGFLVLSAVPNELPNATHRPKSNQQQNLSSTLKTHIFGQSIAIDAVVSAIARHSTGLHDDDRPMVFLFLGPSGTGKTELAKMLSHFLHAGNVEKFIRIDMSEYQEKHNAEKLVGAPPGYVGHMDGGQLTNKLSKHPDAVCLFDEVEKAHPDVLTKLLQLFDEGRLTDGQGTTVTCKGAIFIMTSNLAAREIAYKIELLRQLDAAAANGGQITVPREFYEATVRPILKAAFKRDEFLGRIGVIVYFVPFSDDNLRKLVERELEALKSRAALKMRIRLTWESPVLDVLAKDYNVHEGARSLKREVDEKVGGTLANYVLDGRFRPGSSVKIVVESVGVPSGTTIGIRLIEA